MGGYRGTTKLVSLSIGVVWTAVMLRFMGPTAYVSLSDWLPKAYMSFAGWLTPPYLYLIINGIIISIAASSRFSPPKSVPAKDSILVPVPGPDPVLVQVPVPVPVPVSVPEQVSVSFPDPVPVVQAPPPVPVSSQERKSIFKIADDDEEDFVIKGPRWDMMEREDKEAVPAVPAMGTDSLVEPMVRADSMEMPISEYTKFTESMERPPVSARFSRKSVRPSPEGKALRVTKSRKGETLESTWRTITEGRAMPLTRHLKKSDTWETRASRNNSGDMAPPTGPTMRKSETFHEQRGDMAPPTGPTMRKAETFQEKRGVESPPVGSGEMKVKREPSLGQDDLNRRVEAFIQKFNEEMRMQRQESFKHYMDMVSRGADQ